MIESEIEGNRYINFRKLIFQNWRKTFHGLAKSAYITGRHSCSVRQNSNDIQSGTKRKVKQL